MSVYLMYWEYVLCIFIVSHLLERATENDIENYYIEK